MKRKRNTAVCIDGENIPAKKADLIMREAEKRGVIDSAKVYGLQKDKTTKQWSDVAKSRKDIKDIRLSGRPAQDKVDKKIMRDIIRDVKAASNVDIFIIVSSDHGYADCIRKLRELGKRVIGMGEEKAPNGLRQACSEFVLI